MQFTKTPCLRRARYLIPIGLGLSVILSGVAQPAGAQETDRWYVRGAITGSDLNKPRQTIANAPAPGATLLVVNDAGTGWGGDLAFGRGLGRLRVELELGRSANKSKSYTAISPISVTVPQDGHTDVSRLMANAYYDMAPSGGPWRLFVGAGLGEARTHVTSFAAPARAPTAPPSQLLDYRDTNTAYQLMAGAGYALNPHVTLTAQYGWLDAGKAVGTDSRGERATREAKGSNLDFGVSYAF